MSWLSVVVLSLVQFIAGMGMMSLSGIRLSGRLLLPLALLLGIAVFSFVPFLLQLFYIPITATNVFVALGIATALLNIRIKRSRMQWREFLASFRVTIKLYEIPFLAIITFIVFVSVWRCFYYPPLPRDLTSGPEVIAEYTTKEYTMVNSVFSVDLSTTNNQFKPAFITSLQIIYKYAGFPFGQIWLCTVFISFILFLYEIMIQKLHRLLAGILILFFLAIPEMYAYTILVLFDYSNAVFFFLATYFLFSWFEKATFNYLLMAGLLSGIATYIRSETLVLTFLFIPLIIYHQVFVQKKKSVKEIVVRCTAFLAPAILLYLLSITIYINYYLPVKYSIDNQVTQHLSDIGTFFTRLYEINSNLLTGKDAYILYGSFLTLFVFSFLAEAIFFRLHFTNKAKCWLYAILVVYLGYPFLGYLLPLLDINNSTKRGLFKLFPLMLLYLANNQLYGKLSAWLNRLRH